ncbi:alkaline phosphatase [Arenibacter aquaticus]|uniref:Alkaline phosphatase n=1 Tax=Arenibacter aquaticus TaxID=2489054 RepID=A0A430K4R8_9FLAO|nr:alkaline phosphatase D family protein [Arenibacter aquaticus]RTE53961.1 alkaline phosphatase [Arenibacter aquaticus]
MIKTFSITLLIAILITSCNPIVQDIYLGQGIMAGEATSTSVILQSRLTLTDSLVNGDISGANGIARFEIDTDSTFENPLVSDFLQATSENDFIIKKKIEGLQPGNKYFYRLQFGKDKNTLFESDIATFKTLPGPNSSEKLSMVVVTGMNHYFFHYGKYEEGKEYSGEDKRLGYPALQAIQNLNPDYFIGTGDNVYFDHPHKTNFDRAVKAGKNPHPGGYNGMEVVDEEGMRRKYHEQFAQPRFLELFSKVATYWEKDDHDYRYNDADPYQELPISHELGIKNFKEQLPVVDLEDIHAKTYRTHRMNQDLQLWFLEGRDYRSPNKMKDGPDKTMLGTEQLDWLKETLLESDASFKLIISPTPMVGPDDAYKTDNHVNHDGFRHEGEAIFQWLVDNDFLEKNLYIICGDRHWQYHAMHPSGIEEFSTGALVDNNSRAGRLAGDPNSTDPDSLIKQFYIQGDKESASGGFLSVTVQRKDGIPVATFQHYDEEGNLLYETEKLAEIN